MNDRPRGGMNTSLVEYSSTMSPGAYFVATPTGAGAVVLASASIGIIAPAALAAPTTFNQSRRETESDTRSGFGLSYCIARAVRGEPVGPSSAGVRLLVRS